ncbi:hypothetical protein M433DRAFT_135782 [Acidomyces richmondensis BFW]|nr:MAG: hypothetical protein FE78DRAFT_72516 [Acidomyces sp. 'richmondensis']KYG44191.1 hypothetical protein M433DRAFT_135782 [Acidomyces richmondensis BFW]
MVSWSTLQSLLIFFGPWLLPRVLAFYRSLRSKPAIAIRPLPKRTSYALAVLFISGLVAFLSTLPVFSPANVYRETQSRLQTSPGVLITRLAALRPITPADEKLRDVLERGGLDASLLYARYGPQVVLNCPFATPGDANSHQAYFFYAMPSMLTPHLLHLFALGIATSSFLSGKEGAHWRTVACIAGIILGAAEVYLVASYDDKRNIRSTRLGEVDFIHWKIQVWRGLAIAAMDGVLGWVIWLQATQRAFLIPQSASERMLEHAMLLEGLLNKTKGLGVIRNAMVRNGDMRRKFDGYWLQEGEVMKDVFEQPEVLEAQRNALRRLDVVRVGRDAEAYIDNILSGVQILHNGAATRAV